MTAISSITALHALMSYRIDFHAVRRMPHIRCADGFTMSVQASEYHYCTPRDNKGPYTAFEVGYPSKSEPLLFEYGNMRDEDEGGGYEPVFAWVPATVIDQIIAKHGGVKEFVW